MRRVMAGVALLATAGCTLADVVIPESDDVLVVEGVLRTDRERQAILLHRSVRGGASGPQPGATVVVRTPEGVAVRFEEAGDGCLAGRDDWDADSLEVRVTCYEGGAGRGTWVRPGAAYRLEVTTPAGERATATTVVPGAFVLRGLPFGTRAGEVVPPCTIPPGGSVEIRWTVAPGAWGYIVPLRLYGLGPALPPGVDAPEPLELLGLAVSAADTSIVLPAEFGVFDRFRLDQELLRLLQRGLPAGTRAEVTVAAADRNYINGVRGGSFNPSGRVRISSVSGDGVGVFASLVPLTTVVEAAATAAGRPPCAA
jgi:hypothetical protein